MASGVGIRSWSVPHQRQIERSVWSYPVTIWAGIGAAFIAVQIPAYFLWFTEGPFEARPAGIDAVPDSVKVYAWLLQGALLIAAALTATYLIRRIRRDGAVPFDGLAYLALLTTWWQDTLCNYFRPVFFYNSYLVNRSALNSHILGWVSPHGSNVPEPFLLSLPMFPIYFLACGVLYAWLARRAHARWPRISRVTVFGTAVLAMTIVDILFESIFIRTELFAYPGVIRELSLFGGTRYQFPLYEGLTVGIIAVVFGHIRMHKDDRGYSAIERGSESLRLPTKGRTGVRFFALVGLVNAMFLFVNIAHMWASFYADKTPAYATYLRNDICGPGTDVPCAGPDVPVYLPDTPRGPASPPTAHQ